MRDENPQDREREVRDRIAGFIQANEQARSKQVSGEELQTLKAAAGRLDQLLRDADEANLQVLKTAAARLDRLLAGIAEGKDVVAGLKRRRNEKPVSE
jgi:hypothetical protein